VEVAEVEKSTIIQVFNNCRNTCGCCWYRENKIQIRKAGLAKNIKIKRFNL